MADQPVEPSADWLKTVAEFIEMYQPAQQAAPWAIVSQDVRRAVLSSATSVAVAKKLLPHARGLAVWAHGEGIAFAGALADPDWIERYIAVGMPEAAESTRATRRAALRLIARRVAPAAEPAPERLAYRTLRPPYPSWQVGRFLDIVDLQPTRGRRRNLQAVLTLGLGAGLDGRDLAWVRGVDVTRAAGGLAIRVNGGARQRVVVALDRYADAIERAARDRGESLVIGGSTLDRHNVTSVVLSRMVSDKTLPPLVASRLRSTWLVTHLNLGTPLSLLLPAAGFATARPLGDLLPYVDAIDAADATRRLRGAR